MRGSFEFRGLSGLGENQEQGVEWDGRILISTQFLKDMGCLDRDRLRINGIGRCELRYTSLTAMD